MKRALAMLLLLTVAIVGWLRVACAQEAACCCCAAECSCATQAANDGGCPCGCSREEKRAEGGMPLCPVQWPEAMRTPEARTPVPPAPCRTLTPEEAAALAPPTALWHAPPGAPPDPLHTKPAPYAGFCAPLRA